MVTTTDHLLTASTTMSYSNFHAWKFVSCSTSDEQRFWNKNVGHELIFSLLAQTRLCLVGLLTVVKSQRGPAWHIVRSTTIYQHHTIYFPFKTHSWISNCSTYYDGPSLLNTITVTGTITSTIVSEMFRSKYYFGRIQCTYWRMS